MPTSTLKTVNIFIDEDALRTLKRSKYKLCFAKKVNDTFNVIWRSYDDYLYQTVFGWTPEYQLFGTNRFQASVTVKATTKPVDIGLGQQSILDAYGTLGHPSTNSSDPTAITLVNNYGDIHPGLNACSSGITGEELTTPIYVAENSIVSGSDTLTPIDEVMVWFEQDVETSCMFSTARSNSEIIDLTHENEATRFYKGESWSTPSAREVEAFAQLVSKV